MHTYGRTLDQVRRRTREALGLWVKDADAAELLEEIRLPNDARHAIRRSSAARTRAEREREDAQRATTDAAKLLVERLGLGLRDVGELLGLSYQRIQQLISGETRYERGSLIGRGEDEQREATPRLVENLVRDGHGLLDR
jgi:hypothetical protein